MFAVPSFFCVFFFGANRVVCTSGRSHIYSCLVLFLCVQADSFVSMTFLRPNTTSMYLVIALVLVPNNNTFHFHGHDSSGAPHLVGGPHATEVFKHNAL